MGAMMIDVWDMLGRHWIVGFLIWGGKNPHIKWRQYTSVFLQPLDTTREDRPGQL